MNILSKTTLLLMVAGLMLGCSFFIYDYYHKEDIIYDEDDDEDEIELTVKTNPFSWEIVQKDGETFVVIDDDTDEFFEEEDIFDSNKVCYVYKYPKRYMYLI